MFTIYHPIGYKQHSPQDFPYSRRPPLNKSLSQCRGRVAVGSKRNSHPAPSETVYLYDTSQFIYLNKGDYLPALLFIFTKYGQKYEVLYKIGQNRQIITS